MRHPRASSEPGQSVCGGWAAPGMGVGWDGGISWKTLPAPLGAHYLLLPKGTGTVLRAPSAAGRAHSSAAGPVGQTWGFQRLWLFGKTLRMRSLWGLRVARRGLEAVRGSDGAQNFVAWAGLEVHPRRRWLPRCAPETRCAVSPCRGSAWSTWGLLAPPGGSRLLLIWGAQ